MFKWSCLALAFLSVVLLGWAINDIRLEVQRSVRALNEHLPELLEKTKKSTETLAVLSEDIKQLRDLAGMANGPRDRSLAAYADSILDLIHSSGGKIGLDKKVFGGGLKEVQSAEEWVVAARKEALLLTVRARSRTELLTRLCENKFGSPWYMQIADEKPQQLIDWLKQSHSETRDLASSEETGKVNGIP